MLHVRIAIFGDYSPVEQVQGVGMSCKVVHTQIVGENIIDEGTRRTLAITRRLLQVAQPVTG